MFEFIVLALFVWLAFKVIGLTFRLAWGAAKIIVSLLAILAAPVLILCLLFVGGAALLIPLAMIGTAFGIVSACV